MFFPPCTLRKRRRKKEGVYRCYGNDEEKKNSFYTVWLHSHLAFLYFEIMSNSECTFPLIFKAEIVIFHTPLIVCKIKTKMK